MKTIYSISFFLMLNISYAQAQCNLSVDLGPCQLSFIGYGDNCINITANVSGGVGPYNYNWTPNQGPSATITDCPLAAKTYSVMVTDANGCSATASVQAFVFDVRCGKNLDRTIVCHNGVPTCVSAGSLSKHLSHGDKVGPCLNPCNPPSQSSNGRFAAEFVFENNEEISLNLYPQPTNGEATLEVKNAIAEMANMQILKMNGQIIHIQDIKLATGQNLINLPIQNLEKGNYFVLLKGKLNSIKTKKLMIN